MNSESKSIIYISCNLDSGVRCFCNNTSTAISIVMMQFLETPHMTGHKHDVCTIHRALRKATAANGVVEVPRNRVGGSVRSM